MSLLEYIALLAVFVATAFGLGLPLARILVDDPLEQVCAAAMLGLAVAFIASFAGYAFGLARLWCAGLPALGALGLWVGRRTLAGCWSDLFGRAVLLSWVAAAAWIQVLLTLVVSFSGGDWTIDWVEHHQRALFFREGWALDFRFIAGATLPARPPLANVVVAAFQAIVTPAFACDQVVLGLWSSLCLLPLAILYRQSGGRRVPLLALLLMLNPAFLQNSTYPWTKLPATFFVLGSACFLIREIAEPRDRRVFGLGVFAMVAAVLTHYSALPYLVVGGLWWLGRRAFIPAQRAAFRMELASGLLAALPLAFLWFGWSLTHYGLAGTFLSNSTAQGMAVKAGLTDRLALLGSNLWSTLVPHPLRDGDLFSWPQPGKLYWLRDYFFMIVQVTLPGLLGAAGAAALAILGLRRRVRTPGGGGLFPPRQVALVVLALVILGVAVVATPGPFGLAHICLLPVGLIGLVWLAALLPSGGRFAGWLVALGLAGDALLNVGLHYWLQSRPVPSVWLQVPDLPAAYARFGHAGYNAGLKHQTGMHFLADSLPPFVGTALPLSVLLAAGIGAWRIHRRTLSAP